MPSNEAGVETIKRGRPDFSCLGNANSMCARFSRTRYIEGKLCAESRRADLRCSEIGLAEDWLSQQQDAGDEKEKSDQADGGAGSGHG